MLTFMREMTLKQYKTKKEIEGQNVTGKPIQLCKSTQEFFKKIKC